MKILIVDDERDVEDLFRQKLRKEIRSGQLELVFAFSGQEALDILGSENPPQVVYVFSDINMPGMSGLQATQEIRDIEARRKLPRTPIVAVTANAMPGDRENCLAAGMDGYTPKPVSPQALMREMDRVLEMLAHGLPAGHTPDLLAGVPVPSPVAWALAYAWPVHRLSPDYLPDAPPAQATFLLVQRGADHRVRFNELTALSFRLLQRLADEPALSGREQLLALAAEAGAADTEAFLAQGQTMLEQFRAAGIVPGTATS